MSSNLISSIIPVYNGGQTIQKCLDHIFSQTYKNLEVIIVDDGSSDNTKEILERYNNSGSKRLLGHQYSARARALAYPVRVIHQQNQGAPAARNRGFKESKGDYLLFVDVDVYLKPRCIEKMCQTLQEHPEAAYAYSSFRWGFKKFKLWKFDAEKLKEMPYIHSSSLIRRKCFPDSGWDESLKRFQDWDLWLTMLEQGHQGIWIPEILFTSSTEGNTISSWTPAFVHKYLPWLDKKRIKEYDKVKEIILKKHQKIIGD